MKKIKALYEQLNKEEKFRDRYPHYKVEDGKVHVLMIAPFINGTGYYRMLLPFLELNKTQTHSVIVSMLHKWNFTKEFEDCDNQVDKRLIEWADYIVFPTVFFKLDFVFQAIREVNKGTRLVMDLDCNYFEIPKGHPLEKKVDGDRLQALRENLNEMDFVSCASKGLQNWLSTFLNTGVGLKYLPNLLSNSGFEEVSMIRQNQNDRVRIGLIANYSAYSDIELIEEVLSHIEKQHGEKIELIVFGWNGALPKGKKAFEGRAIRYEKPVSFFDYYYKLNSLALDIALLPLRDIPFNTAGKSFVKFLELSAFAIPVVASNVSPYNEVIKDMENGLLAKNTEEWINAIEVLIKDKDYRFSLGKAALKSVWREYSYKRENVDLLQQVFE